MPALTHRLAIPGDPVRRWIEERFPNVGDLCGDARRSLRGADTVCAIDGRPPTTIGGAIDYRIRYAFALTPVEDLVAYAGAAEVLSNLLLEADPGHPALWDPVDGGDLAIQRQVPPLTTDLMPNPVSAFFERLTARTVHLGPVGRRLPMPEERELDRYCLVLQLFEEVMRTGFVSPTSPLAPLGLETDVDQLLASIPSDWIDDLALLTEAFLANFSHLLRRPAVLNPTFTLSAAVGGADADLIADGMLIEIKTTVNPRIDAVWIRQLVGYVLLDADDSYRLAAIGLYLTRQGRLVSWPLDEALDHLCGPSRPSLPELRAGFSSFLASLPE